MNIGESLWIYAPIFYDNGYSSELLVSESLLSFGAGLQWARDDTSISLHIDNILQFGGKQVETPCVDKFHREFHCGLGVPWVDAPATMKLNRQVPLIKLSISHHF